VTLRRRSQSVALSCQSRRLREQTGLTLMELLIAVALSSLVVTLVSGITSFVGKRYQQAAVHQQQVDDRAHIFSRLQHEFSEIVAWHVTRSDRLVYSSSYTAPGEKRQPYTSTLLCSKQPDVNEYVLVYQRTQHNMPTPGTALKDERSAELKPVQEISVATGLHRCVVEFGVLGVTPVSDARMVHWVSAPEQGDMGSVVQFRIAMADAGGTRFPIIVPKGKK
jgi:prepilin-type N-terminal cleavage/methylation domain-containing protein